MWLLQVISQGNIACVSVQRYFSAINICKPGGSKRSIQIKVLIGVNIVIGVLSLLFFFSLSKIEENPVSTDGLCVLSALVSADTRASHSLFFIVGIISTVLSNAFCILTIRRLRKEVNQVIQPAFQNSSHISSSVSSSQENAKKSIQTRYQKAVITLVLVVICFNLSVYPLLLAYTVVLAGPVL